MVLTEKPLNGMESVILSHLAQQKRFGTFIFAKRDQCTVIQALTENRFSLLVYQEKPECRSRYSEQIE